MPYDLNVSEEKGGRELEEGEVDSAGGRERSWPAKAEDLVVDFVWEGHLRRTAGIE